MLGKKKKEGGKKLEEPLDFFHKYLGLWTSCLACSWWQILFLLVQVVNWKFYSNETTNTFSDNTRTRGPPPTKGHVDLQAHWWIPGDQARLRIPWYPWGVVGCNRDKTILTKTPSPTWGPLGAGFSSAPPRSPPWHSQLARPALPGPPFIVSISALRALCWWREIGSLCNFFFLEGGPKAESD